MRCLCALASGPGLPVATGVPILVLQHPRERRAHKGSARLLRLCLQGLGWAEGECWTAAPAPCAPAAADAPTDVLLYPLTPGDAALAAPPALPLALQQRLQERLQERLQGRLQGRLKGQPQAEAVGHAAAAPPCRLVVIDATWRKAYRMLAQSPWLQSLPRLALPDPPPSRYRIRRARGALQRSTFEAVVLALAVLEGPGWPAERLMAVFDAFNDALARPAAPDAPFGG